MVSVVINVHVSAVINVCGVCFEGLQLYTQNYKVKRVISIGLVMIVVPNS